MQSFVMSVAAAMIGGSIFTLIMPSGNLKKVMAFTLNLFFIASLLSPFIISVPKIDIDSIVGEITQKNDIEDQTQEYTVKLASDNLKRTLSALFKENGYKVEDLNIEINLEGQNTSVEVIINEEERRNEKGIEDLIKNETGLTPKILYDG